MLPRVRTRVRTTEGTNEGMYLCPRVRTMVRTKDIYIFICTTNNSVIRTYICMTVSCTYACLAAMPTTQRTNSHTTRSLTQTIDSTSGEFLLLVYDIFYIIRPSYYCVDYVILDVLHTLEYLIMRYVIRRR